MLNTKVWDKVKITKLIFSFILVTIFFTFCGFSSTESKIYDDANLFTEREIETLQKEAVEAAQKTKLDIIIATTSDTNGKSSREYADDFYDDHNFGYEGSMESGILLLIDMDHREIYLSTSGKAIGIFSDKTINATLDVLFKDVSNENYYSAGRSFIKLVKKYEARHSVDMGNTKRSFSGYLYHTEKYLGYIILFSFILTTVVVLILNMRHKYGSSPSANAYLSNQNYHLKGQKDTFINTTVTSRKKTPPPSSSSGGSHYSSTHTSSSGNTHGGGGRSF